MVDPAPQDAAPGAAPANRSRHAFPRRLASSETPGRVEFAIAMVVLCAVFGVAFLIFNLPGPLVVQVRDDSGLPVMGARVSCQDEKGAREFHGITNLFGEAKWPGLEKGMWYCRAKPPDRFHGAEQDGSAQVRARSPATVIIRFNRPVHVNATVKRPRGAPRARMAVRALCPATQTGAEAAWEARAAVISGDAVLWIPFGRECRLGLVQPSLPDGRSGLVEHATLDCAQSLCSAPLSGPSGASIDVVLEPTPAQWEAARPPPEPESRRRRRHGGQVAARDHGSWRTVRGADRLHHVPSASRTVCGTNCLRRRRCVPQTTGAPTLGAPRAQLTL